LRTVRDLVADDQMPTSREPAGGAAHAADDPTDSPAFARLFDAQLPRVYGFIARRVADRRTAEELTAVVFTRTLEVFRSGGLGQATFGGFAHLVAASAVVDHERRVRENIPAGVRASDFRYAGEPSIEETGDGAAARAFAAAVDRDALRRSVLQQPEAQLRLVLLKYLDGLETDEQCNVLGLSHQELTIQLHRALRMLRGMGEQEAFGAA
jgi:RNA polymerase sigma-70 factor, ECF subfamily